MKSYWTTTSTGYNSSWTSSTSYGNMIIKYIIKKKK